MTDLQPIGATLDRGAVPVMLAQRAAPERAAEPDHGPDGAAVAKAHLLPLPLAGRRHGNLAVLYCGAVIPVAEIEAVERIERGAGEVVCTACLTAYRTGQPPAPVPGRDLFNDASLSGRVAAAQAYVRRGWTVLLRHGQVRLSLDDGPVAIGLPEALAVEVLDVLLTRRCSPAVLVHPRVRTHQMFVVTERFPVALGWPAGVRRLVSGSVPLPPTRTSDGPVRWVRPPEPGPAGLCREIDIVAALRTVHQNTAHHITASPASAAVAARTAP